MTYTLTAADHQKLSQAEAGYKAAAEKIQADAQTEGSKGKKSVSGLFAAMLAIINFIEALNHLQTVTSQETGMLAKLTTSISNAENTQLEKDRAGITAAGSDATALQNAQKTYELHQTEYNNWLALPQSLTESFQNAVSDISQSTTSGYQNTGQLIAIWTNLASIQH